jgi:aldehyde:ferredoxin oxidoreductase
MNSYRLLINGWEKISGESMAEMIEQRGGKKRHMGCAQCIVHCSNEFVDEGGNYVTSSLEYETVGSMGGMTGVAGLDIIAALDRKCDDIGVDTMREFNRRAGFTKADDRLPEFFYKEPLPPHNTVFSIDDDVLDAALAF